MQEKYGKNYRKRRHLAEIIIEIMDLSVMT
jgi:hypothetical protein